METPVTEVETLKTKKNDLLLIDPRNIVIEEGFNVRTDMGDLDGLANSIIEFGQLEPIFVMKIRGEEKFALTDGHRRMAAIRLAIEKGHPIPYVRAIVSSGNLEDRIFAMVITGIGKKPLTSVEEGEAYKRLKAYGYKVDDIAKRVGKSLPHIYNMLKLADVPMVVKQRINEGVVSGNTVLQLLKDVKTTDELLEVIDNASKAVNIENEVESETLPTETGKTTSKANTKKKKVTAKSVGILSPMKKLEAALIIADEKNYQYIDMLQELFTALNNKNSKVENIAKIFK
jgi:ParB family chromosome partitioning protein